MKLIYNKQTAELIIGCKNNNRRDQKLFYEKFYGYVMYYAVVYSKQQSEAKEITNESLYKFFKSIKDYDTTKPIKPWLKTITIRTAINYYNKKINKQNHITELQPTTTITTQNIAEQNLAYEELLSILNDLPRQYKMVFSLFAIEGLKHQEIADQLNISVGTSKSNYHRARQQLIEILETKKKEENERQKISK